MSCSGPNVLGMAGCGGGSVTETGSYVWGRQVTIGVGPGWPPDSTVNDCSNFGSFSGLWSWASNYPDPTECSGDGSSMPAMGQLIQGVFSANTNCPDSYYSTGITGVTLPYFRFTCAPCTLVLGRAQVGFQYSTEYWIVETYSSICTDGPVYVNRACTGSVVGHIDYTPVELGLPYISGTSGCPIPGCRCSSTNAGGGSNRYIFAPANGYSSRLNGSQLWVPSATSITNAAIQAALMTGGSYYFNTGWNVGPCSACTEDPFDSGLP